jgi:dUTP pyrophosphatase
MKGFKKVKEGAIRPKRATKGSAGYDFYALETVRINPMSVAIIPTGVATDGMKSSEVLILSLRSSVSVNRPVLMTSGVGVIDSDYEATGQDISIMLFNRHPNIPVTIEKGERIAQGVIYKYITVDDEKPPTAKRTGGTGSTGTK